MPDGNRALYCRLQPMKWPTPSAILTVPQKGEFENRDSKKAETTCMPLCDNCTNHRRVPACATRHAAQALLAARPPETPVTQLRDSHTLRTNRTQRQNRWAPGSHRRLGEHKELQPGRQPGTDCPQGPTAHKAHMKKPTTTPQQVATPQQADTCRVAGVCPTNKRHSACLRTGQDPGIRCACPHRCVYTALVP